MLIGSDFFSLLKLFIWDILANEASAIATDETKLDFERKDARLVTGIMGTKSRFGLGIDSLLSKIYCDPKTGYSYWFKLFS